MREIKFRAWDGSKYFRFDNHKYDLIFNDISGWNIAPNITGYKGEWTAGESQNKTPNFILEQFTGLCDKKGTEIYEGDILDFGNKNPVPVIFDNGAFCVFDEPLGWDFDSEEHIVRTDFKYCEVIGNIHENPELL